MTYNSTDEKGFYDTFVDQYEMLYKSYAGHRIFKILHNRGIALLEPHEGDTIFEVGCGSGIFTQELLNHGVNIVALDLSEQSIKKARKKFRGNHNVSLLVGDAQYLPFKENTFNKIICKGLLHHIPNLSNGIGEISRVCQKDGVFVAIEPSSNNIVLRPVRKFYSKISKKYDPHQQFGLDPNTLTQLLNTKGLQLNKVQISGFIAYPLVFIAKSKTPNKILVPLLDLLLRVDHAFEKSIFRKLGWFMIIKTTKA